MCQCTRIIVFGDLLTPLPSEMTAYSQIHIVSERWLEACLRSGILINDAPFLLHPVSDEECSCHSSLSVVASFIIESPSVSYITEWENDIASSIDSLFDGKESDFSTIFRVGANTWADVLGFHFSLFAKSRSVRALAFTHP